MQKVAFFDIDGTVFRSSLLVELVEELINAGSFPESARDIYFEAHTAWRDREGSYDAYINAVVEAFIEHIKGVHYGELADIGRIIVAKHGRRTYRYTRQLIAELKKQNYYIIAISQSPKTILDEFCRTYGFDKVYGRIYEIGPQDRFTGAVTDLHLIENKANIVRRVFERHGDTLTQDGSIGVGDTEGDIPLLELVSQPICFNPNVELYEYAERQGWRVVVERKDVIYEL